jgi:hypothetical protein
MAEVRTHLFDSRWEKVGFVGNLARATGPLTVQYISNCVLRRSAICFNAIKANVKYQYASPSTACVDRVGSPAFKVVGLSA